MGSFDATADEAELLKGAGEGGIMLALASASPSSFSSPNKRSLSRGLLELAVAAGAGFDVKLTFSGFSNWRVELLVADRLPKAWFDAIGLGYDWVIRVGATVDTAAGDP